MTTDEIRKRGEALKELIRAQINEFQQSTGAIVNGIHLMQAWRYDDDKITIENCDICMMISGDKI